MAKSKETFNKKEREKKRLRQKQEKMVKIEERKARKKDGNSLESMMAYLDENGNLTDVPSDPRIKRTFRQEDIVIGVVKREDTPEDQPHTGTVIFFNEPKGFGFITDQASGERIFFHVNDLIEQIKESDKVEYLINHSPRGLNAVAVRRAG
jgi:cold shock CspA family protein